MLVRTFGQVVVLRSRLGLGGLGGFDSACRKMAGAAQGFMIREDGR